MDGGRKRRRTLPLYQSLTSWHKERCLPYSNILNKALHWEQGNSDIESLPMLPVQLFKKAELSSVPDEQVIKVLKSSGTTSQQPSKIYLDRETASRQTKALSYIMKSFIGGQRLPMVIVDSKAVIQNRQSYSARGAGILGFSNFGRDHFYLLDEEMKPDWEGLRAFLDKHADTRKLIFGFTFIVWLHLYKEAVRQEQRVDFGDSVLIHGGGWKKLEQEKTDSLTFNRLLRDSLGIRSSYNYYGMVEQVGSIFMECEQGWLHTPDFADVLVRDPYTLEVLPNGKEGIVQVMSLLPSSYPGHNLLTEDVGVILGEDNCPCGRHGKMFRVSGRLPAAEIRGCSDTYSAT